MKSIFNECFTAVSSSNLDNEDNINGVEMKNISLYNKLFNDSEEDYLRILKTSPKNFVWELIDKIENDLYTTKEEIAKDYNVSFIIPKYEEYVYLPNGKIDLTQEEIFTIDNEGDMCLDDAMSIKRNNNGKPYFENEDNIFEMLFQLGQLSVYHDPKDLQELYRQKYHETPAITCLELTTELM